MLIKESELRQIIKEEILNEFLGLGLFKRGANKQDNQRKKIYLTEQDKKIAAFIETLKQAKKEIADFRVNPRKPTFNQENEFTLYDYTSKAIEGYDLFVDKIFPIISSISNVLKENEMKYEKFKYPLHIGYTFYEFFNQTDIVNKSTISLQKSAKEYFVKLKSEERKEIISLVMFFRRIFVYIKKNDMVEFLADQFSEIASERSQDTLKDEVKFDASVPRFISPGRKPSYLNRVSSARK